MANLFGKPMEWDNNMDAFDDVLCLCAELSHVLPLKVGKLSKVCSSVYGGWKAFFDELIRTGAVLEAHPDAHPRDIYCCSASVFIHPKVSEGSTPYDVIALVEKKSKHSKKDSANFIPQHGNNPVMWSFPLSCGRHDPTAATTDAALHSTILDAVDKIGNCCYQRELYGYAKIDLMVTAVPALTEATADTEQEKVEAERIVVAQALDLSFGLAGDLVAWGFADSVLQGSSDSTSADYMVSAHDGSAAPRCMVGCSLAATYLQHMVVGARCLPTFFDMCAGAMRTDEGDKVAPFDLPNLEGILFALPGMAGYTQHPYAGLPGTARTVNVRGPSISTGLGMICVSSDPAACWKKANDFLEFLSDCIDVRVRERIVDMSAIKHLGIEQDNVSSMCDVAKHWQKLSEKAAAAAGSKKARLRSKTGVGKRAGRPSSGGKRGTDAKASGKSNGKSRQRSKTSMS